MRDAVVAVREDTPGDRRLAAYLVMEDRSASANPVSIDPVSIDPVSIDAVSIDSVREALRAELPAHMVPSAFVVLAALPLGPSGKVDRRALPAPRTESTSTAAPFSHRERAVAEVWREVLGTDAVGPDDNFFDLGGNSLLLIRLAARLKDVLGSDVTAVELFRFPTVRALAAHLGTEDGARTAEAPPSTRDGRLRQGTSRLLNFRRGAPA